MHSADFGLSREVLVHTREAVPWIVGYFFRLPHALPDSQRQYALNTMTITFQHLAFATLVVPAHNPEGSAYIRDIVGTVEPWVFGLVWDFVAGGFPVQFVPREIGG